MVKILQFFILLVVAVFFMSLAQWALSGGYNIFSILVPAVLTSFFLTFLINFRR